MIKSLEAISEYALYNQKKRKQSASTTSVHKEQGTKNTGFGLPSDVALQVSELVTRLLSIIQNSTKVRRDQISLYENLISSLTDITKLCGSRDVGRYILQFDVEQRNVARYAHSMAGNFVPFP